MPGLRQAAKPKRKVPLYPFSLDALAPLEPEVRRLFSGFAVYIVDRIVCKLREQSKSPMDNGMWLVLSERAYPADVALRKEFPSLRPIGLLGRRVSHWLVIPSESPLFEQNALHTCDRLLQHDSRFGRVPKSRR